MSMKVLINDYPHRTLAIATDEHALLFRHVHSNDPSGHSSSTSLPLPGVKSNSGTPRCVVEFSETSSFDLSNHRNVAAARGTLGLITLNNDVFICVVTGSVEVATLRPGETVQRIYSVEFYCLNRSDYDHSHGHPPNPYPGQTFSSEEYDYGSGYDSGEGLADHPFHALQKLLSGGNFYYSVDFDLTRRLQDRNDTDAKLDIASLDEGLLWNSYMIDPLLQFRSRLTAHERETLDQSCMLTSVIRGFARTLAVPPSSTPIRRKVSNLPASITVISRLSSRRAGTRFNSRGIDDNGNVANFVETETIFWSPTGLCFSYVQIRGSVPVFWESTSSLIPGQQKVHITRSPEATQPSFDKHFSTLEGTYGAIHVVNLLSKGAKPAEVELSERFRMHIDRSPLSRNDPNEVEDHNLLRTTEFDFHEYTRGGNGYEGAKAIRPYIDTSSEAFVYFLSEEIEEWATQQGERPKLHRRPAVIMQQNGVFRVNCLDCLDRTNLVQGMISQMAIELFLNQRSEKSNSDFWMRHSTLWADNGDALSKIYAGTGALKSSFTRHGKMSLGGVLADARKSATRLYVNHFEDKNRQNIIDLLLGRLTGQTSVDLFDPINDWVVSEVGKRRLEFESRAQVKVFVGTFNLNGKTQGTNEDLAAWLKSKSAMGADVVVVGFQEIVDLNPQQIMSTDPNRRMIWETAVRNCLNNSIFLDAKKDHHDGDSTTPTIDDYILLRSGQLVGCTLFIFVRTPLLSRITNVEGALKKTGLSGIAGNKGAVAIRFDLDSTSLCFVTAHLAAGFGNYEERNRDYATITGGLRFSRERGIDDHEVVVWAGDFNYRVGLSYDSAMGLVNQALTSSDHRREDALGKLYENDQLNIQMVQGNCFPFYREGRVTFLPTYKFDLGRDDYDTSEKARIPAWTDRILWKINLSSQTGQGVGHGGHAVEDLGTKLKQLEYGSVMKMRFSDHRPVYSTFELGVRVIDEVKKDALAKKLYLKRAKEVRPSITSTAEEGLEDTDSSELEDFVGYESIQEGLPPASSDRRKWWLDGNKGASSTVNPPGKGMMLNPNRKGNPWADGPSESEEEWVKVERPEGSPAGRDDISVRSRSGTASSQKTLTEKIKPEPPPSRQVSKRMVPPVWEGERRSASVTPSPSQAQSQTAKIRAAANSDGTRTPPPPPEPRRPISGVDTEAGSTTANPTPRDRLSSISSTASSPNSTKQGPPPKPSKPTSLASLSKAPQIAPKPAALSRNVSSASARSLPVITSSRYNASQSSGAPQLPQRRVVTAAGMGSQRWQDEQREQDDQPRIFMQDNDDNDNDNDNDGPPPPLPKRTPASSLIAQAPPPITASKPATLRKAPPLPDPRHPSKSRTDAGAEQDTQAPPPRLPPRRATDLALMDAEIEDHGGGGVGRDIGEGSRGGEWEVLKPS